MLFRSGVETPVLHANAAHACSNLALLLKDRYFRSRGSPVMPLGVWMMDDDSPYQRCIELRERAADHWQRVIDLDEELDSEDAERLEDRISELRHG